MRGSIFATDKGVAKISINCSNIIDLLEKALVSDG